MNAFFAWLDVDRSQWRALLGASLRADFAALRTPNRSSAGRRMASNLALALTIYALAGLSPAMVAWIATDRLFAATVMATMVGFMLLSTLLLGEGTTIISPTDHHVLGFRPVTSRTYLAVRIAAILVRTAVIASCVALAPVCVFFLKGGFHPALALAALASAYAVGIAVTLAVVAMYAWLLRIAGPARMTRWATYTQFAAQTVVWLGFFVATQGMGQRALAGASLSGAWWALLYPGTWFGSYVALAAGDASAFNVASALLSVALVAALGKSIGGKLSLGYAESLARIASGTGRSARAEEKSRWMHLLNSETRAVAILVRSHLRHDMKFRLGIVSLIPITLMYLYLGGMPSDPFVPRQTSAAESPVGGREAREAREAREEPAEQAGGRDGTREEDGGGGSGMVILAALFFLPPTLRRVLVTSQAYRASWIFHTTPSDHAKLVLSSRNIITLFFLIPYLLILAAFMAYAFDNVLHALAHAAFTGTLSYLVLQMIIMFSPELPFSLPVEKETQGARMFAVMFGSTIVGIVLYVLLTRVVYRSGLFMLAFTMAVLLAASVMDRVTRRRASAGIISRSDEG